MGCLHIVNGDAALERCRDIASQDDAVMLIEDGVYAAMRSHSLPLSTPIYALDSDLDSRGVVSVTQVKIVSVEEFVDLTVSYQPIISW